MSISRLQGIIDQYRERLARHEAISEASLDAAHKRSLAAIRPQIDKITKQIAAKQSSGEKVPISWLYEKNRLKTIEAQITGHIDQFGALAQTTVGKLQYTGARIGEDAAQDLMQASVPPGVDWSFGVPSQGAMESIVGANQDGSPLADLFSGFGAEASDKAGQALILGITLGENPRRIASMIEEALGISRNRALTIARTEMLRSYRLSALANYRENSKVIGQWRWNCSLSPRTCIACLSEDGTLHDLDEEMQSHPCCRCSAIPVSKSWSDILSDTDIDTSNIEDINLDGLETGSDWFGRQDESTQRDVMGSARYELYADGTPLSDFVGRSHSKIWGDSIFVKSSKDV